MPGMRRLQAPVTFVEGVQVPVLLEGHRLRQVEAHLRTPGALVDVVAEVDDEVEIVLHHRLIGGEVALAVVLGGEGEAQAILGRAHRRGGAGPTDRASLTASDEPIVQRSHSSPVTST
jgi:hypothetical protein